MINKHNVRYNNLVGKEQLNVFRYLMQSDEGSFFNETINELMEIANEMPRTYETKDIAENNKIAHLHYFKGGFDFYMVEMDALPELSKCFGFIKGHETEWDYISLPDILKAGVELDLHWTPKSIAEIKKM